MLREKRDRMKIVGCARPEECVLEAPHIRRTRSL